MGFAMVRLKLPLQGFAEAGLDLAPSHPVDLEDQSIVELFAVHLIELATAAVAAAAVRAAFFAVGFAAH